MLRPRLIRAVRPSLFTSPVNSRRSFHHKLPELAIEKNADFEKEQAIPGFLSAGAFHSAWYQYQYHLHHRLSQLVANDEQLKTLGTKSIALATARDPAKAHIFNYASMAFNNHFFFEGVTVAPEGGTKCPEELKKSLEKNFSSMDTLRQEFIATANAMFGPGFVWLVKANIPSSPLGAQTYRILTTYLAGSPWPEAHFRKQSIDTNTIGEAGGAEGQRLGQDYLANQKRALAPPAERKRAPGGVEQLTPLLCVNTWEHVWVPDYGFEGVYPETHSGKKGYLEAWWDSINWQKIADDAFPKSEGFRS